MRRKGDMEVYIEYVIIDNFVIDCLISVLTLKSLRLKASVWRVIVAAAFGTTAAIFLPLLHINIVPLVLLRLLVGAAMAFIIYNHKSVKRYIVTLLLLLMITFILGGAALGIMFLTGSDITAAAALSYQTGVPVGIIIAAVGAAAFFIKQLTRYLHKTKDISGFIRQAELFVNGESVKFEAFMDSGNQLYDRVTGLPVIIIESTLLFGFLKNTFSDILAGTGVRAGKSALKDVHYIEYSGLNGVKTKLLVFRPDKLVIYFNGQANIIYGVMAGVYYGKFDKPVKYSAILHPALTEREKADVPAA